MGLRLFSGSPFSGRTRGIHLAHTIGWGMSQFEGRNLGERVNSAIQQLKKRWVEQENHMVIISREEKTTNFQNIYSGKQMSIFFQNKILTVKTKR